MARKDDFNAKDRIDLKLLESHTHFLTGEIEEANINEAIKWLVYENINSGPEKILTLYINSTGGDLYQAFALIDTMHNSKHTVRTIGIGSIMSAAFLIFACGTAGQRYIGKNTGIMCHQFSNSQEGKYHDIKSQAKENDFCNKRMYDILKAASGLDGRIINSKLLPPSDMYFTAAELVDLHIADHVI
jgi:ATP-dependent Clp protease protease subunit